MSDELRRLLGGLEALATDSGIRFAVIGGVARGAWARPRATLDLDVIAGATEPGPIEAAAGRAGFVVKSGEAEGLSSAGMMRLRLPDHPQGAVRVDVIFALHPFYERVLERARPVAILGAYVAVASAEDLVLLKLLADRPQDRADVEAVVEAVGDDLDLALLAAEAASLEIDLPERLRRPR